MDKVIRLLQVINNTIRSLIVKELQERNKN